MPTTGSCAACGYSPVAVDARNCPRCGASNPNPGVANRFAGRGMLWGLGAGAVVGAILGWFSDKPAMALGGALLGAIPGLFVGLVVGLMAAVVDALSRGRQSRGNAGDHSDEQSPGENVYVQFPVDGLGTEEQFALRIRIENLLDAELKSIGAGQCGGGDMGSGKATVFLAVRDPDRSMPRLLNALRRERLLTERLLVVEDMGAGYRFWWPEGYRGGFSLL